MKKRLSTFQEFLKEKKLNESNVNIECEFWDECITEVLSDLEDECNGCFDWTVLGDYIKTKYAILGRTWDEYIDNIYILHIKDLIWAHHSKSFTDGTYTDNAALHSKGVVVEQLAATIYDKLCEKLGDSTSNTTKIKVADYQPDPVPDDDGLCYDLPFESKKVKKYKEYLKEAVATKMKPEDSNNCVDYCLGRIEMEAGSLEPDAVFDAAVKYANGRAKARLIAMYVRPMVEDYLNDSNVVICNLDDTDDENMQNQVIDDALDVLMDKVVDDVLYALYKVNGGKDVETK